MRFAGQAMGGGFTDWLEGNNSTFDAGKFSKNSMEARSQERNAVTEAESQVNQYGLNAMATVKAAEYQAEATKAQGAAAGQMAMAEGFGSLASGLAGGIGGGGGSSYAPSGGWDGAFQGFNGMIINS